MNAKHTPGPWRSLNFGTEVRTEDMRTAVASLGMGYDHEDGDGRRTANARLIAAAPDLLAALRALVEVAEGYEKSDTEAAEDSGEEPYVAPRIKAARSAIARATGGGA